MHVINLRRCIACREQKLKENLIRISKHNDQIIVDDNKKINGRAVYVCKNADCIEKVIKKKLLNKVYSSFIQDEVYISLENYKLNKN